jgi:hypothetical protein
MFNKLLLTSLAVLTLCTMSFAVFPVQAQTAPVNIPNFKCGPGLYVYKAQTFNGTGVVGSGMRCVKYTTFSSGQLSFAWYGEGYDANCSYRILGHAAFGGYQNPPTNTVAIHKATAADIWGNGECRQTNHNSSLIATTAGGSALTTVKLSGSLTEVWTRVPSMSYTPLPRPSVCGNPIGLTTYKAVDDIVGAPKTGQGIRCVLNFYYTNTTWFGNGWWYNPAFPYTEIGTSFPGSGPGTGYGTSTIGGAGYGVWNVLRPYGSFTIAWGLGFANVSVPKDERWY